MKIDATDAATALSELAEAGFTHDFRFQNGKIVDVSTGHGVNTSDVTVAAKLRFETEPDLGDASNIYARSVGETGVRGFLVDALDLEGSDYRYGCEQKRAQCRSAEIYPQTRGSRFPRLSIWPRLHNAGI